MMVGHGPRSRELMLTDELGEGRVGVPLFEPWTRGPGDRVGRGPCQGPLGVCDAAGRAGREARVRCVWQGLLCGTSDLGWRVPCSTSNVLGSSSVSLMKRHEADASSGGTASVPPMEEQGPHLGSALCRG